MQFGANRCKCTLLLSAPWWLKETVTDCPKKQILIPNIVCHGFYALCNLQAGQARPAEPRLWPSLAVNPSAMEMPKWQVHFIIWRPSVSWAHTRNWKRKNCSRGGKGPFWMGDTFGWRTKTMPAPVSEGPHRLWSQVHMCILPSTQMVTFTGLPEPPVPKGKGSSESYWNVSKKSEIPSLGFLSGLFLLPCLQLMLPKILSCVSPFLTVLWTSFWAVH